MEDTSGMVPITLPQGDTTDRGLVKGDTIDIPSDIQITSTILTMIQERLLMVEEKVSVFEAFMKRFEPFAQRVEKALRAVGHWL